MTPYVHESPWLRRFATSKPSGLDVFCFPHAGGSASFFRGWGDVIPDLGVSAIQYPGREDRASEPLIADMSDLVKAIGAALLPLLPERFALLGHSMGARVAYWVTCWLESRQRVPCCLLVSASTAPHVQLGSAVHLASDTDLFREMERLNGTPAPLLESPGYRDFVAPVIRNDYRLLETHFPESVPIVRCPILACYGCSDPDLGEREMRQWADLSVARFNLRQYPGDHFYLRHAQLQLLSAICAVSRNRGVFS